MSELSPHLLRIYIATVLKDQEIHKGLSDAYLSEEDAVAYTLKNSKQIQPIADELEPQLEGLTARKTVIQEKIQKLIPSKKSYPRTKFIAHCLYVIIFMVLAYDLLIPLVLPSVAFGKIGSLIKTGVGSRTLQFILLFLSFIVIYAIAFLLIRYFSKALIRSLQRLALSNSKVKPFYDGLVTDLNETSIKIERLTSDLKSEIMQGIKELLRDYINSHLTPSYSTTIDELRATGLGEVIDLSRTISTRAKEKLQFCLETMPGGSIGIAGSRGSGKSTLIQTYCRFGVPSSEINGRPVLPIFTSAPVKFEFRDFVLHLFAMTCKSVLAAENSSVDLEEELTIYHPRKKLQIGLPSLRYWLTLVLAIGGLVMMVIAYSLKILHEEYHNKPRTSVDAASTDRLREKKVVQQKADNLINSGTGRTPTSEDFLTYYFRTISADKERPARLFSLGVLFLIGLFIKILSSRNREDSRIAEKRRPADADENLRKQLLSVTRKHLKKIRYQQSVTTGWSGGLKSPIAFEGSVSEGLTSQERPLSNPELIAEYTEFLSLICHKYQIIIGIDELDKLESDVEAHNFMNEIKSLFGVRHCFFLLSVSENAMGNFERRGMPFRDVFDSSFDNIIYVDFMTLEDTLSLLQRRVIGRPVPFFYLTYCLSGGLPRDVIRLFREIVRISQEHKSLTDICRCLIIEDVQRKFFSMSSLVKKIDRATHGRTDFLKMLSADSSEISIDAIKTTVGSIRNLIRSDAESQSADRMAAQLTLLLNETMAYLGYSVTVWELFTSSFSSTRFEDIKFMNDMRSLAKARQSLSADFEISASFVDGVRSRNQLKKLFHA